MASVKEVVLLFQTGNPNEGLAQQEHSKEVFDLLQYPHPKGHSIVLVLRGTDFYEIQSVQPRKYGSWFINQRVSSSKQLYLASKMDPRFLLLPYFEKSNGKYSPLEQIVHRTENHAPFPLEHAYKYWKMEELFDVNDQLGDDMILYRYNEAKLRQWLKQKVERTAAALAAQRARKAKLQNPSFVKSFVNVAKSQSTTRPSTAASVSGASSGGAPDSVERRDIVKAADIICDYLTPQSTELLLKEVGLSAAELARAVTGSTTATTTNGAGHGVGGGDGGSASGLGQKRKADWEEALELEKETLRFSSVATAATTGPICLTSSTNVAAQSFSSGSGVKAGTHPSTTTSKTTKANLAAAKGTKKLSAFFGAKK